MAETSRSQVTITLGRSGQVVKRAGAVLDREFSDPVPAVGSKRSVRDRLGSSADVQLDNKRLRGDNGRLTSQSQGSNFLNDFHLSKDDLRFKIMKRTQTNGQHNTIDLRDMLSRRARSSTTNSISTPPHSLHESQSQSQSQRVSESRDDRRRMPMPDPRDKTLLHMDERQRVPQTRDVSRQGIIPKINGGNGMTGQYNSMRSSEAPSSQMGFLGNSYSPWSLDHIRRKSPERVLNPPPTRRIEEPQRRIITREYENPRIENPRTMVYSSRDSGEISRPMGPFLTKPPLSGGPVKSLPPPSLPPGTNLQRSQYPVQEHVTVEGFLRSLGLEKYVISFKVEEVDMAALSQMGDHDLKELGIPMGPRKKILLALIARTRRQAR
ncbi:uncharacterized protein LOC111882005 [Lactuca sativa]|uniref:uncharacterized protein LOC111882005 n=1 Tax=Lactuca sativa TaxID=4236 RepID=UPI000CBB55E8|nr:uncharacterized protein LOC111882005 [Lactuca sativa]